MTKRSVSKSAIRLPTRAPLEIVALLLHLGAEAVHYLLADLLAPLLDVGKRRIEDLRLDIAHLAAKRRLVERKHVFQLLLAEAFRIELRRVSQQFVAARGVFGSQLGGYVIEVLGELWIGLQQSALGLLDHADDNRIEHCAAA